MNLLQQLEQEQVDKLAASRPIPEFQPGDTLRVGVKVVEGERERIQLFEGVCIGRKNAGVNSQFHFAENLLRRGSGAHLPAIFAPHHLDRCGAPRRGAAGQALLPARPHRQGWRASPNAPATACAPAPSEPVRAHDPKPNRPPQMAGAVEETNQSE